MTSKVVLIWEPEWRHDFNVFPAKFWIFKFFFLMIFAIKMLLDNIYGLLNLFEFKINHFNSLVQAKSEFKNSNFGGKYIEIMSSLMFSNKYDFRYLEDYSSFSDTVSPYHGSGYTHRFVLCWRDLIKQKQTTADLQIRSGECKQPKPWSCFNALFTANLKKHTPSVFPSTPKCGPN